SFYWRPRWPSNFCFASVICRVSATGSFLGVRFCLNILLALETIYTKVVSKVAKPMNTFLPPIEKPRGLMMKLAYYFTRKQFGKVLTPVKLHSARLPAALVVVQAHSEKLGKNVIGALVC